MHVPRGTEGLMTHIQGRRCRLLFSFFFLISTSFATFAQNAPAAQTGQTTVRGTVTDALGARVAGAEMQLLGGGAAIVKAKSNAQGEFVFSAAPGRYVVQASAAGFDSQLTESFFVSGAELAISAITLAP